MRRRRLAPKLLNVASDVTQQDDEFPLVEAFGDHNVAGINYSFQQGHLVAFDKFPVKSDPGVYFQKEQKEGRPKIFVRMPGDQTPPRPFEGSKLEMQYKSSREHATRQTLPGNKIQIQVETSEGTKTITADKPVPLTEQERRDIEGTFKGTVATQAQKAVESGVGSSLVASGQITPEQRTQLIQQAVVQGRDPQDINVLRSLVPKKPVAQQTDLGPGVGDVDAPLLPSRDSGPDTRKPTVTTLDPVRAQSVVGVVGPSTENIFSRDKIQPFGPLLVEQFGMPILLGLGFIVGYTLFNRPQSGNKSQELIAEAKKRVIEKKADLEIAKQENEVEEAKIQKEVDIAEVVEESAEQGVEV